MAPNNNSQSKNNSQNNAKHSSNQVVGKDSASKSNIETNSTNCK